MNEAAANALYEAERKGVRQIKESYSDDHGGRCAMGVLQEALLGESDTYAGIHFAAGFDEDEWRQITRWNDHGLTFSEIARKLGPDTA